MINLKKLFRRKKGQGALEYLFMIAAALIIIFVVVRYISGTGQQATSQSDIAALQSQAELVKSSFQAKGWWTADSNITLSGNQLQLDYDGDDENEATYQYDTTEYPNIDDYFNTEEATELNIMTIYDDCQAGNLGACEVFGVLAGSTS